MTRYGLSAALLLGLTLTACDTAPTAPAPDTAAPTGTAASVALAEAPADDAATTPAARSHRDPALVLQPTTNTVGWLCYGEPCQFAVEFTVPAGATWTVTEIDIDGRNAAPDYAFDGFDFAIHADAGGTPAATPLFARTDAAFTASPTDQAFWTRFGFDVSGASAPVLPAGTYWLAFDMVNEAAGFQPEFAWRRVLPPVGLPALVSSPDGSWTPLVGGVVPQDLTFNLYGYALSVDVRPGSAGNPVQIGERGLLPVAILTTDAFDATTLDPASITLGDGQGAETPVATRRNGSLMASLEDVDGDGDLDLVVHVSVAALVASGDLTAATTQLVLSATLADGTPIRGADAVRVVPPTL